ncbi:hypothetical protein J6590_102730, partial [Homalodisca vitripennis]
MPPVTRGSGMLNCTDGLYHLNDEVIELASNFCSELKKVGSNFGNDIVEKLVPHISAIMAKLDSTEKLCRDLKIENEGLCYQLQTVETKFTDLNSSYRNKCNECDAIEDDCDLEIKSLQNKLSLCKQENVILRDQVNSVETGCICGTKSKECSGSDVTHNTNTVISELEVKISDMEAERGRFLTTVQVLEANINYLNSEIVRLEGEVLSGARYVGSPDLMAELSESMDGGEMDALLPVPSVSGQTSTGSACLELSSGDSLNFKNVLLIGDSIIRHAGKSTQQKGGHVECCPGAKINDIKQNLLKLVNRQFSVIYLHVGTNNLIRGYKGGPGYNGGHGKRQALHSMADLLYTVRTQFPNSKVFVNSVLTRTDISYKALFHFNEQIELMCGNFGVTYVEANCSIGRRDLARDGRHLNRR